MVFKSKPRLILVFLYCLFYLDLGQDNLQVVYGTLYRNITLYCPLRNDPNDSSILLWKEKMDSFGDTPVYITSNDGANPNTPLGTRLSVVGNNTAGEYNMKISNLQQSDERIYFCEYGLQKKYFQLDILVPLTSVTIHIQSIVVKEGVSSEIICTTSKSVPSAEIIWYIHRPGSSTPVRLTDDISDMKQNKTTISTLIYTGQKQDNNGNLYCNASNSQQTEQVKSKDVNVTVYYKPSKIQISPQYNPYKVYVGQKDIQLLCSAESGNPNFTSFTWSYNGENSYINPHVITVGKSSGGNYTCTANNTAGAITTFQMLMVQYGPEIQPFTKQQPVEGSKFVLSSFVSGKPAPTTQQIWWTRQNDNTFRQRGNQLFIDNIQKEQRGIYICHAQNTLTPSGQSSINKTATQNVEVDVLYQPVLTTSPNFNPLILYVGQQNVQMTCSSSQANPTSVDYWWTYNKQNYNGPVYTLSAVKKTSGGNYTCNGRNAVGTNSSTVSVVVQYGPTIDPVSPQKFIAGRYALVSCNVNSYPVADITWTGPNNLQQTGQTLIFNKTTKSHTGIYNCTATNVLTPSNHSVLNKQQEINVDIDILYKPEIMDTPSPSIVEGENLTLTCSTRANPTAHSYKWTKIGNNTFQQLSKTLVITNIRRTQSGKYNCTAMNTMTPTDGQPETGEGHGEVTVNVKYAPAISSLDLVGSVREKTEGETATFKCVVDSYPKSNVSWTSITGKRRKDFIDLQKNISLYNITANCLDTGTYICTASNGIGNTVTNETDLFVRCSPRIDTRYKQTNVTEIRIKDGQGLNISVRYLAYPVANVTWVFSHQNSSDNTTKHLYHDEDDINIVNKSYIYWQTSGLTKPIMTEDDFGTYAVTFQNDLSSASSVFYVYAARAPAPPLFVSSECLQDLTVNVSWMPGFNGGSEQMFVIQYRQSSDNNFTIWTNKLQDQRINITENVKGLTNGVKYAFRVVAVNNYGETPSEEDSCTTAKPTSTESPIVLPIVGGTLGTLTGVCTIIIFLVFLRRKKHTKAKKRDDEYSMNGKSRLTERDSCEEEDGMKVNILYEPAGPNFKPEGAAGGKKDIYSEVKKPKRIGNTSGDIYAQVQKKAKKSKEESNNPSDLYAVVQKPKTKEPTEKKKKRFGKGKREKPKKDSESKKNTAANEGNIYENVEKLNAENGAFGVSGTDESFPGPSGAKSAGEAPKPEKPPKRTKNKLIYADLVLEEGTKDGNRFVIRGEEDRTQYVEIDFTKRAKPLPPDNEESEVKSPAEVPTSEDG